MIAAITRALQCRKRDEEPLQDMAPRIVVEPVSQRRGHWNRGIPPEPFHHFTNHKENTESKEEFIRMAVSMDLAKQETFYEDTSNRCAQRRDEKRNPKVSSPCRHRIGKIGAQHVKACMSEVKDTHHAKYKC
jgi:hypothetical protein